MKKILRKMVAVMCVVIVSLTSVGIVETHAKTTLIQEEIGSSRFKDDWKKVSYLYLNNGTIVAKLIYGFDTVWIDEDYTRGISYEAYATSSIKRNGYDDDYVIDDGRKGIGTYSETEIAHKKDSVYYRLVQTATYTISNINCKTYSLPVN